MKRTLILWAAPLLMLHACATQTSPAGATPAPAGECNAANAQFALGQVLSAQLQAQAQQRSGAKAVRVYSSGDAITMDFSTQRLNLELDKDRKVVKASCG